MCEQVLWEETKHLMAFVKGGVVPRIYEYRGIQYPAWEKAGNPHNVWLISKEELNENISKPPERGSYPHLRAEGNGYYIYGFRWNQTTPGQARGEFCRYLANRQRTDHEWKVFIPEFAEAAQTNILIQNEPQKSSVPKRAASTRPAVKTTSNPPSGTGTHADIIKTTELQYAWAIAERFGVSEPENDDVNAAVRKWEKENPNLFYSMFHSADDLEGIDQFNTRCQKLDYVMQKFALFELVIGDVKKAKMIILNNNPGADSLSQSPDELKTAVRNFVDFLDIFVKSQKNGGQQNLKNIYYPFKRDFIRLNCDYFPKRFLNTSSSSSPRLFDCLLQNRFCTNQERSLISSKKRQYQYPDRYFDVWEKLAPYIVSLERFGYHSKYFKQYENQLQQSSFCRQQRKEVADILRTVLEKQLEDRPIILVFRGENAWKELLGNNFFKMYQKVYFVSNNTFPYASEAQIGRERFQQLKHDWNALVKDESLKLEVEEN